LILLVGAAGLEPATR